MIIKYIEFNDKDFNDLTVCQLSSDSERIKDELLTKMGIGRKDGEKALDAYLRVLSEMNGYEFTLPVHRDIVDLIYFNEHARKIIWLLA